jgi:hypothetical protein
MLVLLPEGWPEEPGASARPGSVRILRRGPSGEACGAVRSALEAGERLFLVCADGAAPEAGWLAATDHVSLFGPSPLAGPNRDDLGPRFPSLKGMYRCPEGSWSRGVVLRVPSWELATPAELAATGADAAVSGAVDEAIVAGHGGGAVMMLVRCSPWGATFDEPAPLSEAVRKLAGCAGGEKQDGAMAPDTRGR